MKLVSILNNNYPYKIYLYLASIAVLILVILISPISHYMLGLYHMNVANTYIYEVANPELSQNLDYYCQPNQLKSPETELLTKAIGHLERSKSLAPGKALAYNHLLMGRTYCLLNQYRKAIKAYKEYLQLRPQSTLAYIELALAYEARCRKEFTLFPAEQITTICTNQDIDSLAKQSWLASGQKPEYFLEAGNEKQRNQDSGQASHWYRRSIWLYPEYKDGYYYLGKILIDEKQIQQAIHVFEQGIQAQYGKVGDSNFHFYLARTYKNNVKPRDIDKTQFHALAAIELNDYGEEEWQIPATYYLAGWSYFAQKNYSQSITYLQTSADLNPASYWTIVTLAEAYLNTDNYENALSYALKAHEIQPEQTKPLLTIGEVYMLRGEEDKAYQTYLEILNIDTDNSTAKNRLEELKP